MRRGKRMTAATSVTPESIVRRGRDIPFSELDDEFLAIDAQAGYCYSLNELAGRVWTLISAPIKVSEICAQLRREYAVDEATCLKEVSGLLQGLCDACLVQVGDAQSR